MMVPPPLATAAPAVPDLPSPNARAPKDASGLAEAARQFEAIFLRQMLEAARKADFGGDELFGSAGQETFTEMRDARFADITAETGSLGIAEMLETQLARQIKG